MAAGLAAFAVAVVLAAVLATPGNAAFPGGNGRIVFESERDADLDNSEIHLMNPGGGERQAAHLPRAPDIFNEDPVFSPNARQIIFESDRGGTDDEIFVMNANGGNQRPLTTNDDGDFDPAFTPDGKRIVFESNRDGDVEIWIMNANGGNQRQLTFNTTENADPVVSPDGRRILYEVDNGSDFDLFRMSINGGNQTPFVTGPADDEDGDYSPNGRRIVFTSDRDNRVDRC